MLEYKQCYGTTKRQLSENYPIKLTESFVDVCQWIPYLYQRFNWPQLVFVTFWASAIEEKRVVLRRLSLNLITNCIWVKTGLAIIQTANTFFFRDSLPKWWKHCSANKFFLKSFLKKKFWIETRKTFQELERCELNNRFFLTLRLL